MSRDEESHLEFGSLPVTQGQTHLEQESVDGQLILIYTIIYET